MAFYLISILVVSGGDAAGLKLAGGDGLTLAVSSMLRVERLQAPPHNALLEFGSTLTLNFTIVDAISRVQLGGGTPPIRYY